MPGYDGTGPTGAGPMTGRGRGYCIVKLPENGRLPEIISEVLSEIHESVSSDPSSDDTTQLGDRIREVQSALKTLDNRIDILTNNRSHKK